MEKSCDRLSKEIAEFLRSCYGKKLITEAVDDSVSGNVEVYNIIKNVVQTTPVSPSQIVQAIIQQLVNGNTTLSATIANLIVTNIEAAGSITYAISTQISGNNNGPINTNLIELITTTINNTTTGVLSIVNNSLTITTGSDIQTNVNALIAAYLTSTLISTTILSIVNTSLTITGGSDIQTNVNNLITAYLTSTLISATLLSIVNNSLTTSGSDIQNNVKTLILDIINCPNQGVLAIVNASLIITGSTIQTHVKEVIYAYLNSAGGLALISTGMSSDFASGGAGTTELIKQLLATTNNAINTGFTTFVNSLLVSTNSTLSNAVHEIIDSNVIITAVTSNIDNSVGGGDEQIIKAINGQLKLSGSLWNTDFTAFVNSLLVSSNNTLADAVKEIISQDYIALAVANDILKSNINDDSGQIIIAINTQLTTSGSTWYNVFSAFVNSIVSPPYKTLSGTINNNFTDTINEYLSSRNTAFVSAINSELTTANTTLKTTVEHINDAYYGSGTPTAKFQALVNATPIVSGGGLLESIHAAILLEFKKDPSSLAGIKSKKQYYYNMEQGKRFITKVVGKTAFHPVADHDSQFKENIAEISTSQKSIYELALPDGPCRISYSGLLESPTAGRINLLCEYVSVGYIINSVPLTRKIPCNLQENSQVYVSNEFTINSKNGKIQFYIDGNADVIVEEFSVSISPL